MKQLTRSLIALLALFLLSFGLYAETSSAPLPADVRSGLLKDGIRYFIQRDVAIKNRVELRLVVHAGSVQESDGERGLAHLIEHMEFQGTEHFAPQAIVDFLERAGMKFGPEVNAFTNFCSTQYFFDLPSDKADLLATGYQILEDWARGPKIESGRLEIEKKVVQEERRQRYEGVMGRMSDFLTEEVYQGSAYEGRMPIGDMGIVAAATPAALDAFVKRYYAPANEALVIVGDVDPAAVSRDLEGRFREPFGEGATTVANDPPVPPFGDSRIGHFKDKDLPCDLLNWASVTAIGTPSVLERRRFFLFDSLSSYIVNQRFGEMGRAADTSIQQAYQQGGKLAYDSYYRSYAIVPMNGKILPALGDVAKELERISQNGFTQSEFELAKKEIGSRLDQAYASRESRQNDNRAVDISEYFLTGEKVWDDAEAYRADRSMLDATALGDLNGYVAGYMANGNYHLSVLTMDRPGASAVADEDLFAAVAQARKAKLVQQAEKVESRLVADPPAPGRIVSALDMPTIGATRYLLSNGATVIAKPTSFKKDEIVLSAWAPGGLSAVDDAEYLAALLAPNVFQSVGIGALTMNQFADYMNGKRASLRLGLDETGEEVYGNCSTGDIETMLQIAYLRLASPRRDAAMEKTVMAKIGESVANSQKLPSTLFQDEINRVAMGGHYRSQPISPERVAAASVDSAERVYRRLFSPASGFTFAIVGDFDQARLRELLGRWIASLPAGAPAATRDLGIRPLPGAQSSVVKSGTDRKAQLFVFGSKAMPFSATSYLAADAAKQILDIMLRDVLRNEKGGTYGANVSVSLQKDPWSRVEWSIFFTCDLARQEELSAACLATIDKLRSGGFDDATLAKAKEILVQYIEKGMQENQFWASRIALFTKFGRDPAEIPQLKAAYAALDRKALCDFAAAALDMSDVRRVSLNPED